MNLYTAFLPPDFLDYVNRPIGKWLPGPGPLKPLIAVATSEGSRRINAQCCDNLVPDGDSSAFDLRPNGLRFSVASMLAGLTDWGG